MSQDADYEVFVETMKVLADGTVEELESLAFRRPPFPRGEDTFHGSPWITNAIFSGSRQAIYWMLAKGLDLGFIDRRGYTPLHAAFERSSDDKYEISEALLKAGAPVNLHGIYALSDFTPAHLAAAQDDVRLLKLLVQYGADLQIRTCIDQYATPLEDAENRGAMNAARYLRELQANTS
jgi:ankyrin repeat protein